MKKLFLICIFCLFLSTQLEAQWYVWGQKYCWGCRRFMDFTKAGYDALPFGYEDNINYQDRYDLPLNYYFNNRPTCAEDVYNFYYLRDCIRATYHK